MATVKTAMSMDRALFEKATRVARRMKVSRSRLMALALDDFLRRGTDAELLRRVNQVYGKDVKDDDRAFLDAAARGMAARLKDDRWT